MSNERMAAGKAPRPARPHPQPPRPREEGKPAMPTGPVALPGDPMLLASLVSAAFTERNPFRALAEEFTGTLRNLWQLPKNRAAARQRQAQLDVQMERLKAYLDHPSGDTPHRLDTLR